MAKLPRRHPSCCNVNSVCSMVIKCRFSSFAEMNAIRLATDGLPSHPARGSGRIPTSRSRTVEQHAPTRSRLAQTARSGMLLVVLVEITGSGIENPEPLGWPGPSAHLQHCGRRRLPLYRLRRLVPLHWRQVVF